MPKFSLGTPPGPQALEIARVAQDLGCQRIWLFDSAALYEDIWIWLDRIGRETDIGLGTAVLVPNLRHVMTTASAAATIEHSCPGRLVLGFDTSKEPGAAERARYDLFLNWILNGAPY